MPIDTRLATKQSSSGISSIDRSTRAGIEPVRVVVHNASALQATAGTHPCGEMAAFRHPCRCRCTYDQYGRNELERLEYER